MRRIKDILGIVCSIILIFLLTSAISIFAQGTRKEKGYTYSLKQLIEEAEKNIKKVDEELKKQEIEEQNKQRELEARELFEK